METVMMALNVKTATVATVVISGVMGALALASIAVFDLRRGERRLLYAALSLALSVVLFSVSTLTVLPLASPPSGCVAEGGARFIAPQFVHVLFGIGVVTSVMAGVAPVARRYWRALLLCGFVASIVGLFLMVALLAS